MNFFSIVCRYLTCVYIYIHIYIHTYNWDFSQLKFGKPTTPAARSKPTGFDTFSGGSQLLIMGDYYSCFTQKKCCFPYSYVSLPEGIYIILVYNDSWLGYIIGKSTINGSFFTSYVSLPDGNTSTSPPKRRSAWWTGRLHRQMSHFVPIPWISLW